MDPRDKEITYKNKTITRLFPSGYYEYYSDKEKRFIKSDDLNIIKSMIEKEQPQPGSMEFLHGMMGSAFAMHDEHYKNKAIQAIESGDQVAQDVADSKGQILDNVKHMQWFVDAVAEKLKEYDGSVNEIRKVVRKQLIKESEVEDELNMLDHDLYTALGELQDENDPAKREALESEIEDYRFRIKKLNGK